MLLVGVAIALGARTVAYARHWRDDATLLPYTLACNPRSYKAHLGLGVRANRAGEHRRALRHLERAAGLGPERAEVQFARANALLGAGRTRDALRVYDRAIERWPGRAGAYYNRGNARAELGRPEAAVRDYTRALELAPELAEAWANRGSQHLVLGRPDRARRDLERAVALKPWNARAHYNLGLAWLRLGEPEDARRSLARAQRLGFGGALPPVGSQGAGRGGTASGGTGPRPTPGGDE